MGNAYETVAQAFQDSALDQMVREGSSGASALGNPHSATFNLFTGLGNWKNAVSGGGRQHIMIWGDSNTAHIPTQPSRWAQLLHADLLSFTGIANGGPGYRPLGLSEWTTSGTLTPTGVTPGLSPVESALTGGTYDLAPYGFGYQGIGNTSMVTWTKPASGLNAFDRFAVYMVDDDFIATQSEYSVDGAGFIGTAADMSGTLGTRLIKQEIVAAPTTTLRIRGSNAIFPSYFMGVAFYQGTTGLVVHNIAVGGTTVYGMVGRNSANRLALFDDIQPKLTIIWTGTNEYLSAPPAIKQRPSYDFRTYYDRVAAKARQYGDVLMIYPQGTNTPSAFVQNPVPEPQANFQRAAREIAYKYDCAFIDIHALFGSFARHNARGWAADDNHLSYTTGHAAAFKIISKAIRDWS